MDFSGFSYLLFSFQVLGGDVDWYVTNKLPVFDREGEAIGVMGAVQPYALEYRLAYPFPEIEKAVVYIREHYWESLKMAYLARDVGLSDQSSFTLLFGREMGISSLKYWRRFCLGGFF